MTKRHRGVHWIQRWIDRTFRRARPDSQHLSAETSKDIALENSRLLQAEREQRQMTEALVGAVSAMSSTLNLDQVMETIAEGIVTKLGYDWVLANRYVEKRHIFSGLALYPVPVPDRLGQLLHLVGHPEWQDAPVQFELPYQSGQNPLVDRVLEGEAITRDSLADFLWPWVPRAASAAVQKLFGMRSFIDVPLQTKGKTIGTILAGVRQGPITAIQRQALVRVASQAAIAIENAQLYEQAQLEIAERKRAERGQRRALAETQQATEALRRERDRAQRYLDIAEVMIVVLNEQGAISLINRHGCSILGYEEQELLGRNWFDTCLIAEVRETAKQAFDRLVAGEIEPVEYFEHPVLTRAGQERIIAWHNSVLTDETGRVTGALSSGQDITERVQAEEKLRRANSNLEAMIENTDEYILISDENALPIHFNSPYAQVMAEAFGIEMKPGLQPHTLIPDQNVVAWWDDLHRRVLSGEKFRTEYSHEFSSGQVRHFEILYNPIVEDDQVVGLTEFTRDITERKRAEAALIKAALIDATTTLAGGIAHRINNLMTAVMGNAEFLQIDFVDQLGAMQGQGAGEMLAAISQSAQEASRLAQQMLAFARGGKVQPRPVNLNDTVREVLRLHLQERALPPNVHIDRRLASDLWDIEADATQMSQIFVNLFVNAIESIGGVDRAAHMVAISTRNVVLDEAFCQQAKSVHPHPVLEPGSYVCLSVQDTGVGMSESVLSRLFEPFFSTKLMGRGLGLAAVHGIVRNHNGNILVRSQEASGTTFEIYLPASDLVGQR